MKTPSLNNLKGQSVSTQFRSLLDYAVRAPSGHNTQPWLFRITDSFIDLIADRNRRLPIVDPLDRELTMSCGAALDHLIVAAAHFGQELQAEILPDSLSDDDVLARVTIEGQIVPTAEIEDAFKAIADRRTTRASFQQKPIPKSLATQCENIAAEHGIHLTLVDSATQRTAIAKLVAEGDRIQFANPHFRRELAAWVHSRTTSSQDGMSGQAFGMPDFLSAVGAFTIRTFDIGKGVAAGDQKKITDGSPTLAVFSSEGDAVKDWLAVGRAHSRVLLALTAAGATASYLNQPIEVAQLRPRLQQLAGSPDTPQLLMRFGYGPSLSPSVRRDSGKVLIDQV